jgi:hypothetical protein
VALILTRVNIVEIRDLTADEVKFYVSYSEEYGLNNNFGLTIRAFWNGYDGHSTVPTNSLLKQILCVPIPCIETAKKSALVDLNLKVKQVAQSLVLLIS